MILTLFYHIGRLGKIGVKGLSIRQEIIIIILKSVDYECFFNLITY
jgi:hypothetical protein